MCDVSEIHLYKFNIFQNDVGISSARAEETIINMVSKRSAPTVNVKTKQSTHNMVKMRRYILAAQHLWQTSHLVLLWLIPSLNLFPSREQLQGECRATQS